MTEKDPVARLLRTVDAHPDAIAVIDASGPTTYRDFLAQVVGSAQAFRSRSPTDGPRVAMVLRGRSSRTYAAMFGTLLAGGCYSPLNPDWPEARLAAAIRRFRPDIVLTDCNLAPVVERSATRPTSVLTIDEIDPMRDQQVEPRFGEEAYVIFTSGSTGEPKGVLIPRSGLGNYLDWVGESIAPAVGERWSQHADISFDLSVLDIFGSLCSGATLCPIETQADRLFPARFIERRSVNIWVSVPSVVDAMLAGRAVRSESLSSIRAMVFCGEALRPYQVLPLFEAIPDLVILNTYGPTENTVSCTEERLTSAADVLQALPSIAIGDPIPGTRIRLYPDPGARSGEILLGGRQLALGYLADDASTHELFIEIDGERWYRTGDLTEVIGGKMYFSGRSDAQVKFRGHRIELDEVSGAASAYLGSASVALIHTDRIALVFEGAEVQSDAVALSLRELLPRYMLPSLIVAVPVLPRTSNGKIDRSAVAALIDAGRGLVSNDE